MYLGGINKAGRKLYKAAQAVELFGQRAQGAITGAAAGAKVAPAKREIGLVTVAVIGLILGAVLFRRRT